MKIGFDLDRVFIDYPPFVPYKLIDWLYKNHNTKQLSYRIPASVLEQFIRKITHLKPLRPPIKPNINFIQNFPSHHTLYLISSRYKFLEKITYKLLKKYELSNLFSSIYLNTDNEQPHLFKERTINNLKLDLYVDDDLQLLQYLKDHCLKTKLLWYNPNGEEKSVIQGITKIKGLEEIRKHLPPST